MQNFIVLGLIPGTSFEITFGFWLNAILLVVVSAFARAVWNRRTNIYNQVVALKFAWFIDQYQIQA